MFLKFRSFGWPFQTPAVPGRSGAPHCYHRLCWLPCSLGACFWCHAGGYLCVAQCRQHLHPCGRKCDGKLGVAGTQRSCQVFFWYVLGVALVRGLKPPVTGGRVFSFPGFLFSKKRSWESLAGCQHVMFFSFHWPNQIKPCNLQEPPVLPRKLTWNLKITPLWKGKSWENHLPNPHLLASMFIFRGGVYCMLTFHRLFRLQALLFLYVISLASICFKPAGKRDGPRPVISNP